VKCEGPGEQTPEPSPVARLERLQRVLLRCTITRTRSPRTNAWFSRRTAVTPLSLRSSARQRPEPDSL